MYDQKRECLEAIFSLLNQQRTNLQDWPFTPQQLSKDKEISQQLREVCDRLCSLNSIRRQEWESRVSGFYSGEPEFNAAADLENALVGSL